MTEDAEERILEEAVETSYRKGGDNARIGEIPKREITEGIRRRRYTYSIPYALVKKIANFRRHIWGL